MSLATMVVDLLLKTDKFESGAHKAIGLNRMLGGSLEKLEHTLMHVGAAFAAGFTAHKIVETIEEMAKTATIADRLGIASEKFTGLQFAAKESHVETEKLTKGLTNLEIALGKAVQGDKAAEEHFSKLGLSWRELNNIPLDQALERVADKFKSIPSPAERAAEAAELFGKKVGPELLPLLDQGAKGIERLEAKAKSLGKTFDDQAAESARRAAEAIKDYHAAMEGAEQKFATYLAPGVANLANIGATLIKNDVDFIGGIGAKNTAMKDGEVSGAMAYLNAKEEKRAKAQRVNEMPVRFALDSVQKLAGLVGGGLTSAGGQLPKLDAMGVPAAKFYLEHLFDRPGEIRKEKVAKPAEKFQSNFAQDHEFHGNAALEKGTVAAFTQSRRSQAQNRLVELQQRQLQVAEKQSAQLAAIAANTSGAGGVNDLSGFHSH